MTAATADPTAPVAPVAAATPRARRRRFVVGGVFLLLAVIMVVAFGLHPRGHTATFGWNVNGTATAASVPDLQLPVSATVFSFAGVCVLVGAYQVARGFGRWLPVAGFVVGFFFLFSLLEWGVSGHSTSLVGLAQGTLLRSIPLVLGALSGVLCERSGVVNIAIEGQFLVGAFAAAVVASTTRSLVLGVVVAGLAGGLLAVVLAVFAIRYAVDQIIVGVVLNVFALGITGFLYDRLLVPDQATYNSPATFPNLDVPVLSKIPIVGPLLFNVNVFLYVAIVLVAVVHLALFKTRWGLRVRAVGEHPKAADTVGINVLATRYRNVVLGGILAGIGGAYFTVGSVGQFSKNISSGRGFIALAAMIFGKWSPLGAVAAALLFGFSDALQSLFQILGVPIPSNFLLMAPYLVTIIAVAGLIGRVRAPAADGKPYTKT